MFNQPLVILNHKQRQSREHNGNLAGLWNHGMQAGPKGQAIDLLLRTPHAATFSTRTTVTRPRTVLAIFSLYLSLDRIYKSTDGI
jgi:hypothetical protein